MSHYVKCKFLIAKANRLRIQLKLPNTNESFLRCLQIIRKPPNKPRYSFQFVQD